MEWLLLWLHLIVLVASLTVYSTELAKGTNEIEIIKDSSLNSLVKLLNQPSNQHIFHNWSHSYHDYSLFMNSIYPWLFGKYIRPIPYIISGPPIPVINCHNPKYSRVLTGELVQKPRLIIDLIKFGYDVDKLIIRLYELYHVVDVFVIYEFPVTLIGVEKPMFFRMMVNDTRLQPFQDKLVYIWTDINDPILKASISKYNIAFSAGDKKGIFDLMYFMEEDIIRRFKDFLSFSYTSNNKLESKLRAIYGSSRLPHIYHQYTRLQKKILSNLEGALALQTDGDELPLIQPMAHLRHCELDTNVVSIHLPCFHYKRNLFWLQRNYAMSCFEGSDDEDRQLQRFLKRFLWRTAPYVWSLQTVLDTTHTMRLNYTEFSCHHHMGLGAAVHMSAFNDPIETWMKGCGAVEERDACKNVISQEIISAGERSQITASMIFKSTVTPWCHHHVYSVHKYAISLNIGQYNEQLRLKAIQLLDISIPWIIKKFPENFPFLYYPQYQSQVGALSTDVLASDQVNISSGGGRNRVSAAKLKDDNLLQSSSSSSFSVSTISNLIEQIYRGKDVSTIPIHLLWSITTHPRWIRLCKDSRRRGNDGQFIESENELPLFASMWGVH